MNGPIRVFGAFVVVLFLALAAQLANLQTVQASKLNHDPRNTREAVGDFDRNGGVLQTADGVMIAQSVPSNDSFHYQRQYPAGPLFAFITGYQSFIYGADGIENTYGSTLSGRDLPVRVNDLSKL